MSKYKGKHGGKKGQKIRAWVDPPPYIRAMPKRKRFFSIDVFPKLSYFDLFYHFIMEKIGPKFSHLLTVRTEGADPAPCAENDKINGINERYFGTHILGNNLPFQTSGIPKKNTQPLISIRGLAFNGLLRSSEK